jgi:hypothetical protein
VVSDEEEEEEHAESSRAQASRQRASARDTAMAEMTSTSPRRKEVAKDTGVNS